MSVYFHAEAFGPTGGTTGNGTSRVLGTSSWSRLAIVVREAIQNSWDARRSGERPEIRFAISRIEERQRDLAEFFLATRGGSGPGVPASLRRDLRKVLDDPEGAVLLVEDRGTVGLGGPVHPEVAHDDRTSTNFLRFIFNVGVPRDRDLGAGTYGFGKSSFFALSSCSTIIVDTLTEDGERRLIACALGDSFQQGGMQYSGRCWWGRRRRDTDGVEPLVGSDAETWARRLGFPDRRDGESGTSIMVLGPDLKPGEESGEGELPWDAEEIIRAIMLGYWPKLVPEEPGGRSPMGFRIERFGDVIALPPLEELSPLKHFVPHLRRVREAARSGGNPVPATVRISRKGKCLGWLGLGILDESVAGDVDGLLRRGAIEIFSGGLRHVACMRPAELVAKYREIRVSAATGGRIVGVFMTSSEPSIEEAFAEAEPPAHDDWIPGNQRSNEHRLVVKAALRKIGEEAKKVLEHAPGAGGHHATHLGRLLEEILGKSTVGAGGPTHPGPPSGPRLRIEKVRVESKGPAMRVARIAVHVTGGSARARSTLVLEASPVYLMEGGGALRSPTPVVKGWYAAEDRREAAHEPLSRGPTVRVPGPEARVELRLILNEMYRFSPGIRVRESDR